VIDEHEFRTKADAAIQDLQKALLPAADEHDFEVEYESGALNILFEEPQEAKFVVSPNAPVRQIWISALAMSFKLNWSDSAGTFVLEKTGEVLKQLLGRLIGQQLGSEPIAL
jgi:CyaY protein